MSRYAACAALAFGWIGGSAYAATLAGKVIADPRASLRVSVEQAGRLEAPPGGFPAPGQKLHAGQVIAYLQPNIPAPERRDLDALLATADRDVTLGELQVRRFNAVDTGQYDGQFTLPSLQILGDYRSARARKEQLTGALAGRLPLTAERAGTVLASRARTDRDVAAGDTVFEIGDAGGLAVEAISPDGQLDAGALEHATALDGSTAGLRLIAESFDPELRARRFLFAVTGDAPLRIGEPVRIEAASASRTPIKR
ncbi:HlyD family efflux transporter periplasmic adaptor subunit [Panacagrimonas perspica]|nr:HlyD family secretion protein [Panacagrimonas perspica]